MRTKFKLKKGVVDTIIAATAESNKLELRRINNNEYVAKKN